jgi:hypothetical protein
MTLASIGLMVLSPLGCARNARLDDRVDDVALSLGKVEAQGAMRCAPRELAIARSHLEFAQLERQQGFATRALQHLDVAAENVRAASVLVEPASCVDAR